MGWGRYATVGTNLRRVVGGGATAARVGLVDPRAPGKLVQARRNLSGIDFPIWEYVRGSAYCVTSCFIEGLQMRFSALVFSAVVLGGCAIPARADFLFDFQFGATTWDANHTYSPSEIVYRGTTLGPTALQYVSGDVDGYRPATVTVTKGTYRDLPGLPELMEYTSDGQGDGTDFGVTGFYAYNYAPAAVGVPTDSPATLTLAIPGSYVGDPNGGVYFLPAYDSATLTITQTPEPSGLVLLGTGVMGVAGVVRRRFGV